MKKKDSDTDELRPEYPKEFFQSMKPNRFAAKGARSVTPDGDVAEAPSGNAKRLECGGTSHRSD